MRARTAGGRQPHEASAGSTGNPTCASSWRAGRGSTPSSTRCDRRWLCASARPRRRRSWAGRSALPRIVACSSSRRSLRSSWRPCTRHRSCARPTTRGRKRCGRSSRTSGRSRRYCDGLPDRGGAGNGSSIPQPFHVPTIVLAIEVEVPHGAAPSLDAPVLAVATVRPPSAFDPPFPDHVHDLVALPPPLEDRGHPRVAFDTNLLVEALGHRLIPATGSVPLAPYPNRTYVRG